LGIEKAALWVEKGGREGRREGEGEDKGNGMRRGGINQRGKEGRSVGGVG